MPVKPENTGVYSITNQLTGMIYIGSSKNIIDRFRNHKGYLKLGRHHNKQLQNSWNTHGEKAFIFNIIEKCQINELTSREQFWMDRLGATKTKTGFNILPFAHKQTKNAWNCMICEKTAKPLRKGRCHACDEYYRRHRSERPYKENAFKENHELILKLICTRCGRPVTIAGYAAKGLCKSCYRYELKHRDQTVRTRKMRGQLKLSI